MRDDISRERDRAWYSDPKRRASCPECGASVLAVCRTYFNMGFDRGGSYIFRTTSTLSPHIAKFAELATWVMCQDEYLINILRRVLLGEIVNESEVIHNKDDHSGR